MTPSTLLKVFLTTDVSAVAGVAPPLYLAGHPSPSTLSPHLLVRWPGWLAAPPLLSSGPWVNLLADPLPSPLALSEGGGRGKGEGGVAS